MNRKYDLIERTEKFGISVINFAKLIPKTTITLPLINQFVRSGTSVGANYYEADGAESKNDFKHKIGISKKEIKETMYWLKIIVSACPNMKDRVVELYKEAGELNLIFSAIVRSCGN